MATSTSRSPSSGGSGSTCGASSSHQGSVLGPLPGFLEHASENAYELVELGFPGNERRRDLDHRIAAIVGAADQPALEQFRRDEPTQQPLSLRLRERLPRLLVLDELEPVEAAGASQVACDRQLQQRLE